jgi:protein TonB
MQILKGQIIVPSGGSGWKSGIKIFDVSQLDQIPIATYQAPVLYPFAMRREGITGQVVVEFIVDSNGTVHDAFAFSSTQHEFESAAVSAIMKWRFKPGRKDGHVVITRHMQIPIDFKLDDN